MSAESDAMSNAGHDINVCVVFLHDMESAMEARARQAERQGFRALTRCAGSETDQVDPDRDQRLELAAKSIATH